MPGEDTRPTRRMRRRARFALPALAVLLSVLALDFGIASWLTNRGTDSYNRQEPDKAARRYRQALLLCPFHPGARRLLLGCYLEEAVHGRRRVPSHQRDLRFLEAIALDPSPAISRVADALAERPGPGAAERWRRLLAGLTRPEAAEAMVRFLGCTEERFAWSAMGAFGNMPPSRAKPVLIQALVHPDLTTRTAAALALARMTDDSGCDVLVEAAKTDRHPLRSDALRALADLGDERAAPLIKALALEADRDAIRLLPRLGSEEAVRICERLLETARSDAHSAPSAVANPTVRRAVFRALGQTGRQEAVQLLTAAWGKVDRASGPHPAGPDAYYWADHAAAEALLALGDARGVPALLRWGADSRIGHAPDPAEALAAADRPLVLAALRQALGSGDDSVRRGAALALGAFADDTVLPDLVAALRDPVPWVAGAAALSAAGHGCREAVPILVGDLATFTDEQLRLRIVSALGMVGNQEAVAALAGLLESDGGRMAARAAEVLGAVGSRDSRPALRRCLEHADAATRLAAAAALIAMGDTDAIPVFGETAAVRGWWLPQAVTASLVETDHRDAVAELLSPALDSENPRVKVRAADALNRLGDRRTLRRRLTVLRRLDKLDARAMLPDLDYSLAMTYVVRGSRKRARDYMERHLAFRGRRSRGVPDPLGTVRAAVADRCAESGLCLRRGAELIREALSIQPGNAEFLRVKADIDFAAGNVAEARAAMAEALRKRPGWAAYARRFEEMGTAR